MFISLPLSGIYILQKAKKNMIHYLCERTPKGLIYLDKTEPIYVCERTEKMNNNKKKNYYFFFVKTTQKCFFYIFCFLQSIILLLSLLRMLSVKVTFINGSKKTLEFLHYFCIIMLKKL